MRVEVTTPPEARAELVDLLIGQAPGVRGDDAARMADVYLTDIEAILIEFRGEPPPAVRIRGRAGNDRWLQYSRGVWVAYSFQDRREGGLFGEVVRAVTIKGFEKELPKTG